MKMEFGDGLVYRQTIQPSDNGFVKKYYIEEADCTHCEMTLGYALLDWSTIEQMLLKVGLESEPHDPLSRFRTFIKQ